MLAAMLLLTFPVAQAQENVEITPPPPQTTSSQEAIEITSPTATTFSQDTRQIIRTVPADKRDELDLQPGEGAILNPNTNEWEVKQLYTPIPRTLADLFLEGGYEWTTAITLCLIALLFAAWKAPRWVKEFGLLALIIGILSMMIGFYSIADVVQASDTPISFVLACGGLRVAFICPIYGMIVYALSLLLRIALKPRI